MIMPELSSNTSRDKPRMGCQKPVMGFQSLRDARKERPIKCIEEEVSIGQKGEELRRIGTLQPAVR